MLPLDYPYDFSHDGLLEQWFTGIPWTIQRQVMAVEERLRCIRNPATGIFVVVARLASGDKDRVHPFFATAMLVGWMPLVETKFGEPVEAMHRICEGMLFSRQWSAEHYGETPAQMDAALRGDAEDREAARVAAMLESTRFARDFTETFLGTSLAMSVSDAKGKRLFAGARKELRKELANRNAARDGKSLVLVAR